MVVLLKIVRRNQKNYDNLMQHIRKTHNVNIKTARSFSEKAYKDIITIEDTNPTNNDKWELKPHSDENIDEENIPILGKIVFQCPLLGCNSKLKHNSSVKDHLNRVHKIPRGKKMQDIVTHAQKTFVESKELTNIHFSKKDNKKVVLDKKRLIALQGSLAAENESELQKFKTLLAEAEKKRRKREDERLVKSHFSGGYACIGLGCEEQFENKTQLKKHMFTNHKCEHCNITCDNATNLNIHVEKDTFCLEFYLKKRQKREYEK